MAACPPTVVPVPHPGDTARRGKARAVVHFYCLQRLSRCITLSQRHGEQRGAGWAPGHADMRGDGSDLPPAGLLPFSLRAPGSPESSRPTQGRARRASPMSGRALFTVFTYIVPSKLNNYIITPHVWGGSGRLLGWGCQSDKVHILKKKKKNEIKTRTKRETRRPRSGQGAGSRLAEVPHRPGPPQQGRARMAGRGERRGFSSDNSYGSARVSGVRTCAVTPMGTSARARPSQHLCGRREGAAVRPGSHGTTLAPPHTPSRLSPVTWGGLTTACLRNGSLSPKGMMLPGLLPWWESSSSSFDPSVPEKPFSCLPGCTPFTRDAGDATSLAGELWGGRAGVSHVPATLQSPHPSPRSPWLQLLARQALRTPWSPRARCLHLREFLLLRHRPCMLLTAWGQRQSPCSAMAPGRSVAGREQDGGVALRTLGTPEVQQAVGRGHAPGTSSCSAAFPFTTFLSSFFYRERRAVRGSGGSGQGGSAESPMSPGASGQRTGTHLGIRGV